MGQKSRFSSRRRKPRASFRPVSRAAFFRQRLPCVGLFLAAAVGTVLGRFILAPGWAFAAAAAVALGLSLRGRRGFALAAGVALAFAAAQAWQFRESPSTRLARSLDLTPRVVEAEITVLAAPRIFDSATARRCTFPASLDRLTLAGRTFVPGCRVLVEWNGEPPVYGGRYAVRASLRNCPPPRNPGGFDYAAWLANAGIRSQLEVRRARDATLLELRGNPVVRFAIASRDGVARLITLGIEGTPEATLIRGMTLGETSDAPDTIKDAFRETGTFHLFSVSGLHVGIVAILLWTAMGILGVDQRHSVLIIIPALFFYALLTGLSAASVRAAIMLSIVAAGLLLDRPPAPLNSIGAAGLLILGFDSSQLFNSGFQLSFGAVSAIVIIAPAVDRRIAAWFEPDPFLPRALYSWARRAGLAITRGTAALVAVSLAAWLVSLPFIAFYFHLVSFSSIPANLLAVPLSSAVLAIAAISLVAGALSPWLAVVFNHANFLLTKILLFLVQAFAAIPGSAIYVGPPAPSDAIATLTILDAEAGGSTAWQIAGQTWLVDTGPEFFADSVTIPFLRSRGVNRLDALVLTHGDVRHLGGAGRVLAAFRPRLVLDSGLADRSATRRRLLQALRDDRRPLRPGVAGEIFRLSQTATIEVLHPPAGLDARVADDKAVVLRLDAGAFSALLMADAGIATEQWLLAHARDRLASDLLVMGRHVSGFSGDAEFLQAVAPRAIVATASPFPRNEVVRPEWTAAVRAAGIPLFRQDETGAVTVTIRADAFTVTPFLPAGGPPQTYPISHATDPVR